MDRPHYKFWPPRLPHSLTPPATSLWHNLAISALRYPDKPAIIFLGRIYSYREVVRLAERLAARLASLGVKRGDRVMLDMQNCPQLLIAHFAILRANAVVVPVNPMNRAEELKHYITDPDAKVAITTADLAREIAKATAAPPELVVGPADLALLPHTSGTTGLPKGCMHLHSSIMHNAVASSTWGNGTVENVSLLVVPMFHITGAVSAMHATIYMGGTLVMMPRWDRELTGRLISRRHDTTWTNIPTMIIDLMASPNFSHYDLSSLKHIGGGGASMPQAVAQRLLDQFGLEYIEGYGLTETAAPSLSNPPDRPKLQCLGVPFISCDARVIDPDTLQELPQGGQGEIIVHGPMVFAGYWKWPEATAAAFGDFEGKRFFRTGDLGRVDEDGYFFITDRLKRMINASGFKVWPAEVEALMFRHPALAEACVISTKDEYRGGGGGAGGGRRRAARGRGAEQDI